MLGGGGSRERRRRGGEGVGGGGLGTAAEASPHPSALSLVAQSRSGAGSWGSVRQPRRPREAGRPRARTLGGAPARPAPAPADSCSWARAVLSQLVGLRPLGLPPLRPYPSSPGALVSQLLVSRRVPGCFPFPGPFFQSTLPPAFGERGWKGGGWSVQRRRKQGQEEEEENRRTVGRRPHATLSGHLPSRPAPAHTPSWASYFRTRKVRAALGDSAAGPVPGKPRVCSSLVCRAPSQAPRMASTTTCTRFTDEYQLFEELGK